MIHLISLESDAIVATYKTVREELKKYGEGLDEKPEIVVLTKTDMVDKKAVVAARKKIEKYCDPKNIFEVSVLDDAAIKKLGEELTKILAK